MRIPNRVRDSDLDGLQKTYTYDEDGKLLTVVCVQEYIDGGYTTYTQTTTYEGDTVKTVSAWVGVYTAP